MVIKVIRERVGVILFWHEERVVLRLKIVLIHQDEEIKIPLDFRRHFISFIKTLSGRSSLFKRFGEDKPGYSPYAFSVNFKKIVSIDTSAKEMVVKTPLQVIITTGNFDIMTNFCNGAIAMQQQETVLGLKVQDVQLLPLQQIKSPSTKFRINGHVILRGASGYIDGSQIDEMEEAINNHLGTRFQFIKSKYNVDFPFENISPVKVSCIGGYRKGVCYHYGGMLPTLQGSMEMISTPETLQFLYDYGLGVRTGQGFGVLEVIK